MDNKHITLGTPPKYPGPLALFKLVTSDPEIHYVIWN